MKLLNYTTTYFSTILLVLISIWAVVFYYAMFEEIYDSIDDGLDNRKILLIKRAKKDFTLLEKPQFDEYLYSLEKVAIKNYHGFKDVYKDTVMYMANEEDFEPVRTLESIFKKDDEYYKIKLATSMIEEDDQIENLLEYTIILYISLVISILLVNNIFLRKIWKPFYTLIEQFKTYSLEKQEPLHYKKTNIEEFALLNTSIEKLLEKTQQTYYQQKQFIENASHELQTPLAVAINKLEHLFEDELLTAHQAELAQQAIENLERLTRLNKSLLLISKIENNQFSDSEIVTINSLIETLISNFSEMAVHRNITFQFISKEKVTKKLNPDLAHILFSNLFKNAIFHGSPGKTITINLSNNEFSIANYGEDAPLINEQIFKRFENIENNKTSTGLGLSIAKNIADAFAFQLVYKFQNSQHVFKLILT